MRTRSILKFMSKKRFGNQVIIYFILTYFRGNGDDVIIDTDNLPVF